MVFMTSSSDHVTGAAGLSLTITASKNGGAFASISPTVTERGDGWYSIALTSSHTDTEGDLALHVTGGGADPTDVLNRVGRVDAQVLGMATDTLTAAALASDAVAKIQSGLATAANVWTVDFGSGRTPKQALQFLRNKKSLEVLSATSGILHVYAEDDGTESWQAAVTFTTTQSPVSVVDP